MADQTDIDRVWDILDGHSIGMLTTQFSGGLRARPLDARPDRDAGAIFFVTDVRAANLEEARRHVVEGTGRSERPCAQNRTGDG